MGQKLLLVAICFAHKGLLNKISLPFYPCYPKQIIVLGSFAKVSVCLYVSMLIGLFLNRNNIKNSPTPLSPQGRTLKKKKNEIRNAFYLPSSDGTLLEELKWTFLKGPRDVLWKKYSLLTQQ